MNRLDGITSSASPRRTPLPLQTLRTALFLHFLLVVPFLVSADTGYSNLFSVDLRAEPPGTVLSSENYSIPKLVENNGSGFRVGATYQITGDTISPQPVDQSASTNYTLQGLPLVMVATDIPSCGIFINGNAPLTDTENVDLSLVCGSSSGCATVELSNNGVGWSSPLPYTTSAPWTLVPNDGTRKVFARYTNGPGFTSGVCYDEIELDTTAPSLSISPTGGTYFSTQQIAVTASEPATINYTTDGTDPTTSPTAQSYTGPVPLADDATLSAYGVDGAGHASAVVSETYEICTGSNMSISGTVVDATRDNAPMPLVVINLDSGHSTNTSLTGTYSFTNLPRGWYTIESVTAPVPGYVTYQTDLKLCESSVAHDIVLTRDGTVYGTDTNSGYSSEGVNTSTGNYAHKVMDLALPGIGPSFVFERTYNSQDGADGPLGFGWTWSFNASLAEWPDGEMVMRWGDGKTEVWNPDGSGGWTPMYGVFSTLIENPDGTFTLKGKDLIEHRFNLDKKLAAVVDEYGNTITFTYAGSNLGSVVDTSGRLISFSYDASNRITNILDPIGRSVSFTYDVNGDLVTATNMEAKVTSYTYDDAHRLLTITDPKGNVAITNSYDESRSTVIVQRDALGDETRYLYDAPNKTTTIIDAEGNTFEHNFDDYLRLVEEVDARGYSSLRTFDERGNLETVTDKNGNVTTYEHDDNGNVLTKTEPLGRITTATYDADNNPLTKTDARGHATVFEYDPVNGNLLASYACGEVPAVTCATDPAVLKTAYSYDPLTGQLLTVTEAAGHPTLERTTTYQYDFEGNNIAVIDALGNTSSYAYDAVGRKASEVHPLGRATAYEYGVMDRLILVTDGLGHTAQYGYDDNGNKIYHWDANNRLTIFTYDEKNRLVSRTDAMNQIEEYGYDGVDRRVTIVNPRGATAAIVYDAMGNVTAENDPTGNTVRYEYDGNGNRTAAINAKGHRKELAYNELNLLVEVTDSLGNTGLFQYDLEGNQTHATNAPGKTTISTFDAFNRLETVTDPEGNSVSNTYKLLGQLESVVDARGLTTSYEYDLLGRLVGVTDAETGTVGVAYDELGNRTSITDPRGKVTTFSYDVLNRLVSATDPLSNAVFRDYDPVGNLETLTNADGTTTFQYDQLYRLTEVTQPDLTTVAYTYDEVGNRLSVSDTAGVTSFTYDMGDRVLIVTDPFGNTVGYTYDPNGNRSSIQYPGYKNVYYLFDGLDRVIQVQDWGGVTTTYAYDTAGRLATQVMGNGVVVSYTYDDAGRLVSKEDRTAGGDLILSYAYTLDPNGNRTGLDFTQPLMPDVDIIDQTMGHNDGNQVVTNNAWIYTYDGKGNRIGKSNGAESTTYAYDFNNRLTTVNDGTNLWEYLYTSDGHRITSTENGFETRYLLDPNAPMEIVLAAIDDANEVKKYFVYGAGLLYSLDGTSGERLFYNYDPVGSTVALTNLMAGVTDSYAYLPYGKLLVGDGPNEPRFTFTGKLGVITENNGLMFLRARYYDPDSRQFLSEDPGRTQPVSLNAYSYASGNPTLIVDPKGESGVYSAAPLNSYDQDFDQIQDNALACDYYDRRSRYMLGGTGFLGDDIPDVFGLPAAVARSLIDKMPTSLANKERLNLLIDGAGFVNSVNGLLSGGADAVGVMAEFSVRFSSAGTGSGPNTLENNETVYSNTLNPSPAEATDPAMSITVIVDPSSGRTNTSDSGGTTERTFFDWRKTAAFTLQDRNRKENLSVTGYAKVQFQDQFRYILADGFLDQQTVTGIEYLVANQVAALSQKRYSYRRGNSESQRGAKERRARDVSRSINSLYGQLVSALSKHHVVVRDLSAMPAGATGGIARTGVYAGGGS